MNSLYRAQNVKQKQQLHLQTGINVEWMQLLYCEKTFERNLQIVTTTTTMKRGNKK